MRLARQVPLGRDHAVDPHVEEVLGADRAQHVPAVGAGGDDRGAQPRGADRLQVPQGALVGLDPAGADLLQQQFVLAVAEAVHGAGVRRVVRAAFGEVDAA